jgi:hypothetical protein
MQQTTRDNLIYVAVGLGIGALVALDAFYADSHGRRMWWPSKFAFHAVTTPALLAYFVVRQMRKEKGSFLQISGAVLFATLLQLAILFAFRRAIDDLSGLTYSALAALTLFVVFLLTLQFARLLKPRS